MTTDGLVIRNAAIFDGNHRVAADSIRVEAGVIIEVGRGLRAQVGEIDVDASDRTLLPGLIDAHAHVGSPTALVRAIRFGVTTVCDQAMDPSLARRLKAGERARSGSPVASLFSAGTLVTAPEGHGSRQLLGPIPTLAGADGADRFVADRLAEGSDWIKVVNDDFAAYGDHLPTLDDATLQAVVGAAHRRNRLVVAHVGRLDGVRAAVAAGVDVLGHWVADLLPDQDLLADMRARGTAVIPTLRMIASLCGQANSDLADDEGLAPYLSERDRTDLGRCVGRPDNPAVSLTTAHEGVAKLADAGVTLLAGTDAPFPGMTHGASLHGELEALVAAGLTPRAALAAATSAPAHRFGLHDRGTIAPGRRADLVLVDGDPLHDIRASRHITQIWKAGHPIERQPEQRRSHPKLAVPPAGALAAREGMQIVGPAGSRWDVLTDEIVGGHSTAQARAVDDDGVPEGWSVEVTGQISGGGWAGLAFYPNPMAGAADLSDWEGITVAIHNDDLVPMAAIVAMQSRGRSSPPTQALDPIAGWAEHRLAWHEFEGSDGHDIRLTALVAVGRDGPFRFRVARPQATCRGATRGSSAGTA